MSSRLRPGPARTGCRCRACMGLPDASRSCSPRTVLHHVHVDNPAIEVPRHAGRGVDHVPYFMTDGYKPYRTVLLERYGMYVIGNRGRGRQGADRLVPSDRLNYAIVEKTCEGRRLRKVRRYDVYGHVPDDLMNTSAIERQNLTIRLLSSRARRRIVTFGRSREAVQASLELLKANYNLCMPHSLLSLRRRENDGKHEPVTPAMRMGLTDHVWSIGELMSFCYRQNIN